MDEVEWIKEEIEQRSTAQKLFVAKNKAKAIATLVAVQPYNSSRARRKQSNKLKRAEARNRVIMPCAARSSHSLTSSKIGRKLLLLEDSAAAGKLAKKPKTHRAVYSGGQPPGPTA